MPSSVEEAYRILDFCAGCDRLVWMDLREQLCPQCLDASYETAASDAEDSEPRQRRIGE